VATGAYIGACVDETLQLVNHPPLGTVEDIAALLEARDWLRERITAADVKPLRSLQDRLVDVVDRSTKGDQPGVVAALNSLLDDHRVQPRIGGHDAGSWHLHVSTADASVAEILASESLFGLALLVTELGADRLGRCAAPRCGRAFLDASPNRSRRFCSHRCATRVNVAAHRDRAKARD